MAWVLGALLLLVACAPPSAWGNHKDPTSQTYCNHPPYWTPGPDIYVLEGSGRYGALGYEWSPMIHDGQESIPGGQANAPGSCPMDINIPNPVLPHICPPMGACPASPVQHPCLCRQGLNFQLTRNTNAGLFSNPPTLSPCWFSKSPLCLAETDCNGRKKGTATLDFTVEACRFGTSTVCFELCDDEFMTGGPTCPLFIKQLRCAPELCFTIHVQEVNNCPTWSPQNIRTDEDTPVCAVFARSVNPGCWGEGVSGGHQQELRWSVQCDNPGLFHRGPDVQYSQGTTEARLCYTPTRDTFGCTSCTVVLSDTGGTANGGCDTDTPKSIQVCIDEVNDPPSFSARRDTITLLEDAAGSCNPTGCTTSTWTYKSWATHLSTGSAKEASQTLRFDLTFDDPCDAALFTVPPSVDPQTGDLSFSVAPHANTAGGRSVKMQVKLVDSGTPPAESPIVPLTISITPVNDAPSFEPTVSRIDLDEDQVVPPVDFAKDVCVGGYGAGCANKLCKTTCPAGCAACEYCNEASAPEQQTVVWEVVTDTPALFTQGGQPTVDTMGKLSFTLSPDVNGVARITVTITDDGGMLDSPATGTTSDITVVVRPKNDQPTFTLRPSHTVLKCDPCEEVVVPGFVSGISPGSTWTDEDPQKLRWLSNPPAASNNNNPGLFAVQPFLSPRGVGEADLVFTPAPGATGVARVTAILDDGGSDSDCVATTIPDATPPDNHCSCPTGQSCSRLTRVFTITIADVNRPPTLQLLEQAITVREDPTPPDVEVAMFARHSAGDVQEDATQGVRYNVETTNPTLFATPPAVLAQGTSGILRFTPAPNANGKATLKVTVEDDGGLESAAQEVVVTVLPVNDPPFFTHPAALPTYDECKEESGCPVSVSFASGITLGPANENEQKPLSWTVTPSMPVFTNGRFIPATGELTFTLKKGAHTSGSPMTVAVTLQDDGGTAYNGEDTFTATTTLTVRPVATINFSVGGGVVMKEDDPPRTFPKAVYNIEGSPATLTCRAPLARACTINPLGDVTVTLLPEVNGDTSITVTACSSAGCADRAFPLKVIPVNDPPVLSLVSPITVTIAPGIPPTVSPLAATSTDLGSGSYHFVVPAVASADRGAPNEGSQSIAYTIIPSGSLPDIFTAPPSLNVAGALSFTVGDHVGTTDLTVVAKDDGGTANGGLDHSAPQTLQVVVGHFNTAPRFTLPSIVLRYKEAEVDTPVRVEGFVEGVVPGVYREEASQAVVADVQCACPEVFATLPTLLPSSWDLTFSVAAYRSLPASGCQCQVVLVDSGEQGPPGGHRHRSAPTNFTVYVEAINNPPSFTPGSNVVTEVNRTLEVPGWMNAALVSAGPFEDNQRSGLVMTATWQDMTLLSAVTVDVASGHLRVIPHDGMQGSTPVRLCLRDPGGLEKCLDNAFTVTVVPVGTGGPPKYSSRGGITVDEDSGPYSNTWATALQTGDPSDSTRNLKGFIVRVTGGGELFSQTPQMGLDGVLKFTPAPNRFGTATIEVVLEEVGGQRSSPQQVTIAIVPVDDPPSFTAGKDVEVLEDSGGYAEKWCTDFSAGPFEPPETAVFVVTATNPSLFAGAVEVLSPDCRLRFTPSPNAEGSSKVVVVLKDGVHTLSEVVFEIRVIPVNDPPVWAIRSRSFYTSEGSPTVRLAVASAASAGPLEDSQLMTVQATVSSGSEILSSPPTAKVSGGNVELTVTPAPYRYGTVLISMALRDDGGTANGGVDTTPPEQIAIFVNGVNDPPVIRTVGQVEVLEDAGDVTVDNFIISSSPGPHEAEQDLRLTVRAPAEGIASIRLNGRELVLTPVAQYNGIVEGTVAVEDADPSDPTFTPLRREERFQIRVVSVNDPPSFAVSPNYIATPIEVPTGAMHTVTRVLVGATAGPPDEASQQLSFIPEATPATAFETPPVLTTDGDLIVHAKQGATGEATISVRLRDDGGTDNGGLDTSEAHKIVLRFTATALSFVVGSDIIASSAVPFARQWAGEVKGVGNRGHRYEVTVDSSPFVDLPHIFPNGTLAFTPVPGRAVTVQARVALIDLATGLRTTPKNFTITLLNGTATRVELVTYLPPSRVGDAQWEGILAAELGVPRSRITVTEARVDDTGKTSSGTDVVVTFLPPMTPSEKSAQELAAASVALANSNGSSLASGLQLFVGGVAGCIIPHGAARCFSPSIRCEGRGTAEACLGSGCRWERFALRCQDPCSSHITRQACEVVNCYWNPSSITCLPPCMDYLEDVQCESASYCRWGKEGCQVIVTSRSASNNSIPTWVIPVSIAGAVAALTALAAYVVLRKRRNRKKDYTAGSVQESESRDDLPPNPIPGTFGEYPRFPLGHPAQGTPSPTYFPSQDGQF